MSEHNAEPDFIPDYPWQKPGEGYDRNWSVEDFSMFFDPGLPAAKEPFVEYLAMLADRAPNPLTDEQHSRMRELTGISDGSYLRNFGHVTRYMWERVPRTKGWPVEWGEDGYGYMTEENARNFKEAGYRAALGKFRKA